MFRFILTAFFLTVLTLPAYAAPKIDLDGVSYELAFVNESSAEDLNEYIPSGETLDKWTSMLALHVYHNQSVTPEQFGVLLTKFVVKVNPGAGASIAGKSSEGHIVIDFITWPKDKAYVEYNVFKFKAGDKPGDIIGYQYAMRSYDHPPSDDFKAAMSSTLPLRKRLGEAPFPEFVSKTPQ